MTRSWDRVADVVVLGSGAAGLSAALSAKDAGADVLLLERSDKFGGATAVSGGIIWVPNHDHMHEVGASDNPRLAMQYLKSLSLGKLDEELAQVYVNESPTVLRFLEQETPLKLRAVKVPDYHPEFPGGTYGRGVTQPLFSILELGELRSALRLSPYFPVPVSMTDIDDGVNILDPEIMADRISKGMVGAGAALVAALLKGAADMQIAMERNVRARRLVIEDGVVVGLEAEQEEKPIRIGARRGVIICTGGFEWNDQLVRDLVRGPIDGPLSPPCNEGDGLLMALDVGAAIANTAEAWWMPMLRIPGEESEGRQLNRFVMSERVYPGSIMVNRKGRRFVNEAHNYADIGRTMHDFDPVEFTYANLPAWAIFDRRHLDSYPVATHFPGDPVPKWIHSGSTLADLAEEIGVDASGLEQTVARFNENAAEGLDPDFHRGESAYDLYYGDPQREGPFRTLGPINQPPFYACRIYSGALGTKGGAKTNGKAEVLSAARGGRIPGLYAAGNASASFTGMSYPGGGATIGPALTFGHIAGREAATGTNRF